jgi:hypothetical protein
VGVPHKEGIVDDTVFDELMGETFGQPAANETATPTGSAQAAEAAGWVTEDHHEDAASTEEAFSSQDAEYPEAQSEEQGNQYVDINQFWDRDDNPYKQQLIQTQIQQNLQMQKAAKAVQEMKISQAMVEMDRQLQKRIEALPDMEPEALTKEVQRLIAERDQVRQMVSQAKIAEQQQQAEQIAKVQVVQILAERHGLNDDEIVAMSQLGDPNQMERYAAMAQQTRGRAMSEVQMLRQQLAQYQLAQQAQARRGVDRVGSSVQSSQSSRNVNANPKQTFDEFWASFVGEG